MRRRRRLKAREGDGNSRAATKRTRARQTRGMRGDGKRKLNRYDHTLARADGRGATRFGRRIGFGGKRGVNRKSAHMMRRGETRRVAPSRLRPCRFCCKSKSTAGSEIACEAETAKQREEGDRRERKSNLLRTGSDFSTEPPPFLSCFFSEFW